MNPTPDYYSRIQLTPSSTTFMFDDISSYNRFIDETSKKATGKTKSDIDNLTKELVQNRINEYNEAWYGTTDKNEVLGSLDTYKFNKELEEYITSFKQNTLNLDIIDLDQQKSIKFTEKEVGIFSFDLASLGLIRVYEYYSPLLKRIVSGNYVRSRKVENGLIFYHEYVKAIPLHKVDYSVQYGGYYSNILKRVVSKDELIEQDTIFYFPERAEIPQHDVERKQQVDEQGRLKFSSTFKKSFIEIPKIEKPLPRIDLIINSAYSWRVNAKTEMIWSSMSALTIAEKLSKSGVTFRIIYSNSFSADSTGNYKVNAFLTLKKEGDPFDKNKIALMLSDARYYRFKGFAFIGSLIYDAGYDNNYDRGSFGYPRNDRDQILKAYINYLENSTNVDDQKSALNPKSKIVFGAVLKEKDARNQYDRVITEISKL